MNLKQSARGFGPRDERAMTLVEVVIALAIAGIAIAAIVCGYVFCTNSAEKAALYQAANARAMERLEETRSAKWDTSSWPNVDDLVSSNFPSKVVTLDVAGSGADATTADVVTQISQISTDPPLKQVRVDCLWRFRGGDLITNTIATCRAPDQ